MRLSVHPSVILWLSVLFYLRPGLFFPFLLAAGLHELGHYLALRAMAKPVRSLTLGFSGARMEVGALSYRQELWAAAAGPGTSLLLGLALPLCPQLGLCSLALGCFNLLPIPGLDGGRMLRCAALLRFSEPVARRITKFAAMLSALALWGGGVYLAGPGGLGLWPLFLAAGLLYRAFSME